MHPSQFGLEIYDRRAIQVSTVQESKEMILAVLENQAGPALNIVLLNAGATIYVSGIAKVARGRHREGPKGNRQWRRARKAE